MFLRKYFLPYLLHAFYGLWSGTWRYRIVEHPEFSEARRNGLPYIFAFWHRDELAMLRSSKFYKVAAMTSTSKDGELMTRVLKMRGFETSRGSSTRGGVRALVGMVKLVRQGFTACMAVDGPKGPIYKVKPGVIDLAKHAEALIIPVGVACNRSHVFKKSWNQAYLPWPFARVVMSFGKPVMETTVEALEELIHNEGREAEKLLHKKA